MVFVMTQDTEARRLAEQHKHLSDFRGSQQDRDLGNLARAYLALLERTRLSEDERVRVRNLRAFAEPHDDRQDKVSILSLLAIISRLTQPTSTAGEAWQDIASAPKDGTHLLLLEDGHAFEGYGFKQTSWTGIWFDDDCYFVVPTHWMPLPSAPVTTAPAVDGGGG